MRSLYLHMYCVLWIISSNVAVCVFFREIRIICNDSMKANLEASSLNTLNSD